MDDLTVGGIKVYRRGRVDYATAAWFKVVDPDTGRTLHFISGNTLRSGNYSVINPIHNPTEEWYEVLVIRSAEQSDIRLHGARNYRLEPCADWERIV